MAIMGLSSKKSSAWAIWMIASPTLLIIVVIIVTYHDPYLGKFGGFVKAKFLGKDGQNVTYIGAAAAPRESIEASCVTSSSDVLITSPQDLKNHSISQSNIANYTADVIDEKTRHGLLAPGFDEESCISRYESHLLRKASPYKPSQYLLSKLRNYENLHRKCGPHKKLYNSTMRKLSKSKHVSVTDNKCRYIVWKGANGLGNRMISLASTFLYAVLTDRVLLVEFSSDMIGLFCQPFTNSSWYLPQDFPYKDRLAQLPRFEQFSDIKINATHGGNKMPLPPFVFLNLELGGGDRMKYFHCDRSQSLLKKVPVLILGSDQYFVPSLFMVPSFKQEVEFMFPQHEAVFHFLGQYLFSPANEPWGLIVRFYEAYMAKADQRIGLQIRVFHPELTPIQTIMDQLLSCVLNNDVLPHVADNKSERYLVQNKTSEAVLVASLYKDFTDNLKAMYWARPTVTGEVVGVYQASYEGQQIFGSANHNMKALAEMYLLSLCDVLVTSGESTFGYVAQSLGGLTPWIMMKTVGKKARKPACRRALSMEPCFHFPPRYSCETKAKIDNISSVFPYMKPCEDRHEGVKLVDI
ncbi:hypothetical protein Droror1_Dr00008839 [Drosera rotundifolia]